MWMFCTKALIFFGVIYPVSCSFSIWATFAKNGMTAILNFKFTQKRIIKYMLVFRSRRITIFMSKPTFSGSVTANVPLRMTPDGFNHTKQERPAVAREDALQPIQLPLQYWTSRSFKVYEFYFIWKSLSHFLSMINSNLGFILHLETFYRKLRPNTFTTESL